MARFSQHYRISALPFKLVTAITLQTRDESYVFRILFTSLMVCNSIKFVVDSAFFEFMCFPAFGVVHFQRFPCGRSCTDCNDPLQLGTRIS